MKGDDSANYETKLDVSLDELSQSQTITLGLMSQNRAFKLEEVAEILEINQNEAFKIIDELYTSGILTKFSGWEVL
ncbi:MAG: hypothetical protein J6Z17_06060 [Treponema sp.]|nr:hypothetical protein [Treponema sp.]